VDVPRPLGPPFRRPGPTRRRCIQLSDLADYQPRWGKPLQAEFAGQQLLTLPTPDTGGLALLIALALIEAAELGDPVSDPDAFYWLIRIIETSAAQAAEVSALEPGRTTALWQQILHAGIAATSDSAEPAGHSVSVNNLLGGEAAGKRLGSADGWVVSPRWVTAQCGLAS
jgi:hypothetical protein